MTLRSLPLGAFVLTMLSGCGGGGGGGDNNGSTPTTPGGSVTPAIIEISPSPPPTVRGIGATTSLTATVKTAIGATINNPPTISWTSSASGIATVTPTGTSVTVTSVSPGTSTITATVSGGPSTTTTVAVAADLRSISVNPSSVTLPVGGTRLVTASADADPGLNVTYTWSSSNTAFATVSPATGPSTTITVVAASPVTITATGSAQFGVQRSAQVAVTGTGSVRSVNITPKPAGVLVGGTLQLTANVDADAGIARTVTWSNAPNAFGSVSATGLVTGIAAGGPFKVYATSTVSGAVRDSIDVTVSLSPTGQWIGRKTNTDPQQSGFRTTLVSIDFGARTATDGGCANPGSVTSIDATQIALSFPNCGSEVLTYARTTSLTGTGSFTVSGGARTYGTQWTLQPRVVLYTDAFGGTLSNWTIRDVDALGSWTITNGELIGRNPTSCFNCGGHATQLVLNQGLQPATANWRADIQSNGIVAYNTGAQQQPVTGSNGQFTLWVSDTEKHQLSSGFAWVGGVPATEARANGGVERWQLPTNGIPWVTIASTPDVLVVPWSPTQWQTTTIEKIGGTYSVFFNGQKLYEYTPAFSAAPRIGLYAKIGFVRMDNFTLYTY